jgi:hypothetical protein
MISVDFDANNQLVIKHFAFLRYCKNNRNMLGNDHLFINFKKAYYLVRRKVLSLIYGKTFGEIPVFKYNL